MDATVSAVEASRDGTGSLGSAPGGKQRRVRPNGENPYDHA